MFFHGKDVGFRFGRSSKHFGSLIVKNEGSTNFDESLYYTWHRFFTGLSLDRYQALGPFIHVNEKNEKGPNDDHPLLLLTTTTTSVGGMATRW